MADPIDDLSRFILISVLLAWPLGWAAYGILKRRWEKAYDDEKEANPEDTVRELEREFSPCRRTVIRTQTEYLPFLVECIREQIDGGLEDTQMFSLLERIEIHRPGEERRAVFHVAEGGKRSDLHLKWKRDAWDRIELHVQGSPRIIRALKRFKRRIPEAAPV